MLDEQRRMWLTGDGGGGLPLPLAFSAVVEEIIDHDYASFERLEKVLSDALAFKESRVLASPFRTWGGFTRGIVEQLQEVEVLQELNGAYFLGKGFVPGARVTAIPNTDVWFQVWTREQREQREQGERLRMDFRVVNGDFRRFDRYALEDQGDTFAAALKLARDAEKLIAQAERLLSEGREVGSLGLSPSRERRRPVNGHLSSKPTARELAAAKYGLGDIFQSVKGTRFGIDGKRPCRRCGKGRLPEDYEVYTDGKARGWFLRGVCRLCYAESRSARK
jgi:hypothetical protein